MLQVRAFLLGVLCTGVLTGSLLVCSATHSGLETLSESGSPVPRANEQIEGVVPTVPPAGPAIVWTGTPQKDAKAGREASPHLEKDERLGLSGQRAGER
jgi:hypothetical protein